jgi:hypothetical protein
MPPAAYDRRCGRAAPSSAGLASVDADAACPPFRERVRLSRQGCQRRAIDLLQQLPARCAEPPDPAVFIELRHEVGNRRVDVRQGVKGSVTQPPEQPSLAFLNIAVANAFYTLDSKLGLASP